MGMENTEMWIMLRTGGEETNSIRCVNIWAFHYMGVVLFLKLGAVHGNFELFFILCNIFFIFPHNVLFLHLFLGRTYFRGMPIFFFFNFFLSFFSLRRVLVVALGRPTLWESYGTGEFPGWKIF